MLIPALAHRARHVSRITAVIGLATLLGAGNCGPADENDDNGGGTVDPCAVAGACGGGGSGTGTGTDDTGGGGGVVIVDDGLRPEAWRNFESDVVARVNVLRAQGGVCGTGTSSTTFAPSQALRVDAKLVASARGHADDMGARAYFDHTGLDGRSPFDRMIDAGYTGFAAAENIAAGQTTPAQVVEGWRTSPGHCRNMYNGDLNEIGVGYAFVAGSPFEHYWVQNFGQR